MVGMDARPDPRAKRRQKAANRLGLRAALLRFICTLMVAMWAFGFAGHASWGQTQLQVSPHSRPQDQQLREANAVPQELRGPIRVDGDKISKWSRGGVDFAWLRGDCHLYHEEHSYQCQEILLVVDGIPGRVRSRVVMSGIRRGNKVLQEPFSGTVYSSLDPQIQSPRLMPPPTQDLALFDHLPGTQPWATQVAGTDGSERRGTSEARVALASSAETPTESAVVTTSGVQQAQFGLNAPTLVPPPSTTFPIDPALDNSPLPGLPELPQVTASDQKYQIFLPDGSRSIEIVSRNPNAPIPLENLPRPAIGEEVIIARGGATVLIRDVSAQLGAQFMDLGTISLSANRIVFWGPTISDMMTGNADMNQVDGELYLEGDIVFRQGDRVIYAESMYYNVKREFGMILDAEAITTLPEYQGVVRIKSDVLQQVSSGNYQAFGAAVTTSRLGVPRYWLQSDQLSFQDRTRVVVDPVTNQPVNQSDPYVRSQDNFLYAGGIPVFYWPRLSTSLRRPPLYLTGANLRNDSVFGTQVLLEWDLFQLLGYDSAPDGVQSRITTDYLSERGPAIGTSTSYELPGLFGYPGRTVGRYDSYLIYDTGNDTLGRDRRDLPPEETWRGRSKWNHRQRFNRGWEFVGEFGYVSDRNFLEQYLESEWDQDKDHTSGLRLQRYAGSLLFDLSVEAQVNDFFKTTERLPVLEHYALGLSPLGDFGTWSMKNKVGYQK
ncbi:MAG: organic solvent tolerance protein OstA, partial [Planctomycetota bacterium]